MTLRHRLTCVGLLVCVASVVGSGQAPTVVTPRPGAQEAAPTFRTRAEAVALDVFVTDAAGNPVSGLTVDDFELDENGKRQDITTFRAVDIPVEVRDEERPLAEPDVASNDRPEGRIYVIANAIKNPCYALRARHFLRAFLDRHFGPNDVAAVVTLGGSLATDGQGFTSNRQLLLAAIDKFSGLDDPKVSSPLDTCDSRIDFAVDSRDLREVFTVLARMPGRHKSLIYLNEGSGYPWGDLIDYQGGVGSLQFDHAHEAMGIATRNNITIYPISPQGLAMEETGVRILERRQDQRAMAELTGGFAHINSNDFAGAFERIVRDASTYYMLGFNSDYRRNDGKYVRLNVRVKRLGLTVRTRSGYVSASRREQEAAARLVARAGDAPPPIAEALGNPMTESGHPIRVTTAVYKATGDLATVVTTVETSLVMQEARLQKPDARSGQFAVRLLATDARRQIYPELRHQDTMTMPAAVAEIAGNRARLVSEMALPKGRYQIRVASGSGRVAGNVVYDVDVPDFTSKPLMLGSLSVATGRNTLPTVYATNDVARVKTKKCHEPSCASVDVRDVPMTPWSEKTLSAQHPLYGALPSPPTTVRQFRQADTITVFTEVYDNSKIARPIRVRAELRQPNRPPAFDLSLSLDTSKPRPSGGHGVAFTLPLADIPSGRYVLRIEATASEEHSATREIPVDVLEP